MRLSLILPAAESHVYGELTHRKSLIEQKIAEFGGCFALPFGAHRKIKDHHSPHESITRKHEAIPVPSNRFEAERDQTLRLIGSLEQQRSAPRQHLSRKNLARFALAARERLHAEDARLRKGYVRQIVERIEVDDNTITVRGSKAALASGLLPPAEDGAGEVPKWWRWPS